MNNTLSLGNIISSFFGILFVTIGLINLFWGNDPFYGLFIIAMSSIFFSPVTSLIRRLTGINISWVIKLIIGLFIIWSAVGVGELFDKIDMMLADFTYSV